MNRWLTVALLLMTVAATAQDKKTLDSVDKVILSTIIQPAERDAGSGEPNWPAIRTKVQASFSERQTDRAVIKAQIYYYWHKDWPKFSTALVHFTEVYEDKNDGKLMNKNATMILQHSQDPAEWKAALGWVQDALEKDASNAGYKATTAALQAKISSQ